MRRSVTAGFLGVILSTAMASTASAAQSFRQEPSSLRVGQTIIVDDGTCPRNQVRQVTENGRATRQSKCVGRK
jgi:hypothetical protein